MKTTRPACARVRQLVAVWLGCILWCSAGGARAQVRAELERALTVTRELPGCVTASALRARTAQYLGRAAQLPWLQIEVDLQVPQFRVVREGTVLAERRFARAPTDCSERRDAIALAVAIAIEQVAEESAAQGVVPAEPAAPRPPAAAATDGQPQPTAAAPTQPPVARGTTQPRASANSERLNPALQPSAANTELSADAQPIDSAQASRRQPADGRARSTRVSAGPPPLAADESSAGASELTTSGRPRALVSLLGGAAVLFQALPTAAAAFSVGAELAVSPAWRVGLSGLFSLPVSSAFEGGSVSAQMFGAQLTGCGNTPIFASMLLHGCAGAIGGVIQARGGDFALNLSDQMGWLAGLARARLEFPAAGHVAASVYADGRVNLLRPELQAGLAGAPARTRAVGLFGGALGVELIVRLH